MIKINDTDISAVYVGDTPVSSIYLGDTQIWGGGGKDYSTEYFTLSALESGTFTWGTTDVEYSLNDGAWTTWDDVNGLSVSSGDKVRFRSSTNTSYNAKAIAATGNFDVEGNSMSLFYGDNFSGQTVLPAANGILRFFFRNSKVINAKNLVLPATTLKQSCYQSMFQNCTSLTTAPELPAAFLPANCYDSMFMGCTSLTTAPSVLSGEIGLFPSRISYRMFYGCISLTTAPEIRIQKPYNYMFQEMFSGCTNLNYVKCLATDISATNCTANWLSGVAPTGTFVKDATMTSWGTGTSGIPDGWTVQDA